MGSGVSSAVFLAVGVQELQKVCDKLTPNNVGEAVITYGAVVER